MHITEIKIAGFKSFVDPVSVPVEQGLTGIVGPNGCGKSNVLEALRWVMGATSARAMRGGEMDDLIFSGSAGRPARELAEVTMVLDNTDRRAPPQFNDQDRIEVLRRLKRGAGSTFKMNGRTVRGKDVQLLFADASTGANSPALVRQGQISEMIASKPQNRRRILEEAAGIAGLNTRRHEAELKLNAAEANLERLSEVSAEVERQLGSLRRQAGKARKYQRLTADINAISALIVHHKWDGARAAKSDAQEALRGLRADVERLAIEDARAEKDALTVRESLEPLRQAETIAAGKVGQAKVALARLESDRDNAAGQVRQIEADIQRMADDLTHEQTAASDARQTVARLQGDLDRLPEISPERFAADRADAQRSLDEASAALTQAQTEADEAADALATLRAQREAAQRNLASLKSAFERAEAAKAVAADELSAINQDQDLDAAIAAARATSEAAAETAETLQARSVSLEQSFADADAAHASADEPLRAAQHSVQTLETEIAGLERLLRRSDPHAARPIMDDVRATRGYEKALAAALGDELTAPTDRSAPSYWTGEGTSARPSLPTGVQSLDSVVDAPTELAARLSQCGIVSAEDGAGLQSQLSVGQRLVSTDGHLWRWDGYVRTPKAPVSAAERLEQQSRLDVARKQHADEQKGLEDLKTMADQALAHRTSVEDDLKSIRGLLPQALRDAARAREDQLRAEQALEKARLKKDAAREQLVRAEAVFTQAEADYKDALSKLDIEDDSEAVARLDAARSNVVTLRQTESSAKDVLQTLEREHDRLQGRRAGIGRDLSDWTARAERSTTRIETLSRQKSEAEDRLETARATPEEVGQKISAFAVELERFEAERRSVADKLAGVEASLREAERKARDMRDAASQARERSVQAQANLETAEHRLNDVIETAKADFGRLPEGLMALATGVLDEDVLGEDDASLQRRLETLKRDRDALGGVNPDAEQEAEELAARLGEQQTEKEDLIGAIAKLREGIDALNSEGRGRLLEAFETVNTHFQALFSTLFAGGQAELRLTDSDDPLSAGLEIFAQPPGKRLGTLSLMSGGEQALTAASLIFAVFLSNPAPICVLDEVDAPLDDANVDRFCTLLDEMRQRTDTRFVVITHNPVTMSRMDRLFGVTMQERGVSRLVSVDLSSAEQLVAAE